MLDSKHPFGKIEGEQDPRWDLYKRVLNSSPRVLCHCGCLSAFGRHVGAMVLGGE